MERIKKYLNNGYLWAAQFVPIGAGGQPGSSSSGDAFTSRLFPQGADLAAILTVAFQMALSVGAILAVLRIAYAGYLYMGQADMWSTKGHAKEVFQNAIIGLLMLFAVWLVLNQINPDILQLDVLRCLKNSSCAVGPPMPCVPGPGTICA